MKRERPELSKKSLYHISKHRYYELKHFIRKWDSILRDPETERIANI